MRELYREPDADPKAIASRIASALDARTREDLSGPGVACCLSSLLRGSATVARAGLEAIWQSAPSAQGPAALRLAQALRQDAERQIVAGGFASRFADLGLNALGTAALEAAAAGAPAFLNLDQTQAETNFGAYAREGRLDDLSLCFVSHDFDHLFRYLVSRDLSDFIGSPSLPTVAHGSRLRDAVTLHCRRTARQAPVAALAPVVAAAAEVEEDEARQRLTEALRELTNEGLQRVIAAGG